MALPVLSLNARLFFAYLFMCEWQYHYISPKRFTTAFLLFAPLSISECGHRQAEDEPTSPKQTLPAVIIVIFPAFWLIPLNEDTSVHPNVCSAIKPDLLRSLHLGLLLDDKTWVGTF